MRSDQLLHPGHYTCSVHHGLNSGQLMKRCRLCNRPSLYGYFLNL